MSLTSLKDSRGSSRRASFDGLAPAPAPIWVCVSTATREKAAERLQHAFRARRSRGIYNLLRRAIEEALGVPTRQLLKIVAPREAELIRDRPASVPTIMLRLGGERFPPRLLYKIVSSSRTQASPSDATPWRVAHNLFVPSHSSNHWRRVACREAPPGGLAPSEYVPVMRSSPYPSAAYCGASGGRLRRLPATQAQLAHALDGRFPGAPADPPTDAMVAMRPPLTIAVSGRLTHGLSKPPRQSFPTAGRARASAERARAQRPDAGLRPPRSYETSVNAARAPPSREGPLAWHIALAHASRQTRRSGSASASAAPLPSRAAFVGLPTSPRRHRRERDKLLVKPPSPRRSRSRAASPSLGQPTRASASGGAAAAPSTQPLQAACAAPCAASATVADLRRPSGRGLSRPCSAPVLPRQPALSASTPGASCAQPPAPCCGSTAKPVAAQRPQSAQPAHCRRAAASRPSSTAAPTTAASLYASYVSFNRPPEPIAYEWSRSLGSDGGWVAFGDDMRGGGLWRDPAAAPPRKRPGRTALDEALGDASQPGDAVRRARGGGSSVSFLGMREQPRRRGGGGAAAAADDQHGAPSEYSYYDDYDYSEYEYDDDEGGNDDL